MPKLAPGQSMPDFELEIFGGGQLNREALIGQGPTLMFFHRYAACPVCSVHLAETRVRHAELTSTGARVIAVFHSGADKMERYVKPGELPFAVLLDPDRISYTDFGVESSAVGLMHPKSTWAVTQAALSGHGIANPVHIDGPLATMPACFLFDDQGILQDRHYARHLDDMWKVEESMAALAQLAEKTRRKPRPEPQEAA